MFNFFDGKTTISFFFKQKWHIFLLIINLFLNLLIWLWIFWRVKPQAEPIPLSYNLYFGIDYLNYWQNIFIGPIAALLIIIINYCLAFLIFLKNKFLSWWLILLAGAFQLFLLLFYIILIINFY